MKEFYLFHKEVRKVVIVQFLQHYYVIYLATLVIINSLNCLLLQKADIIEAEEIVEPPKPEKKKTRKEKKGSASLEDDAGDADGLHGERNGQQKATKKVRSTLICLCSSWASVLVLPVSSCRKDQDLVCLPQTQTRTVTPALV